MVTRKKSRSDVMNAANRKLTFVPLVFIVCRIWGTLRFLIGNFGQSIVNEPYVTWIIPLQVTNSPVNNTCLVQQFSRLHTIQHRQ